MMPRYLVSAGTLEDVLTCAVCREVRFLTSVVSVCDGTPAWARLQATGTKSHECASIRVISEPLIKILSSSKRSITLCIVLSIDFRGRERERDRGRERGKERKRNICLLFHLFMHPLVAPWLEKTHHFGMAMTQRKCNLKCLCDHCVQCSLFPFSLRLSLRHWRCWDSRHF